MKALIFAITLAISTYAGAITLGEYTGEGNLSVVKTDSDNKKTSYQVNCNVAYNIENTDSAFELPFGVVQCNAGMETWNERSYSFKKEGNQLFLGGSPAGNIEADGTIKVAVKHVQKYSTIKYSYDMGCNPSGSHRIDGHLETVLYMSFKPAGTDGYQISRQEKGESLEARYFKPHPHCASTVEYSVHTKESSLKMTVRKSTTTP